MDQGLLDRMRENLRRAVPVLQGEGWDEAEIRAISPAVKSAIDADDVAILVCWADWLEGKVESVFEGAAVVPVLGYAAEARIADKKWKESER